MPGTRTSRTGWIHARRVNLALLALMAIGFGLRVWGVGYGLPYLYHPDEPLGASVALNMIKSGDLNPHFFGYGSLFFYLNALAYIPFYLIGQGLGLFHSPADIPSLQTFIAGVGRSLMPAQIVLGRLVSVAMGVVCLPAVYWLGARLFRQGAGLLATAFVAFSPALMLHSQFITPNMLVTLMVLVVMATLVRLTPHSRWPSYVLVGVSLGAAITSKYNAIVLIIACGTAFFGLHGWRALRRPETYLSALAAMLTFVAITPYAVLDYPKFVEDTSFHLSYYATVDHAGMEGNTVEFYVAYLLESEGLIAFLGLLWTVLYLKARHRNGMILASFVIPYVLYISTLRVRNDRTILLVLPVLYLMAAGALAWAWQQVSDNSTGAARRMGRATLALLVMASLFYQSWQAVAANIRQTTPDGREYARQWIESSVSQEAYIAAEAYSPFIDPARYRVAFFNELMVHSPEWYEEQGYDLLVFSSHAYARYYAMPDRYVDEITKYDALFSHFREVARFDQNGVTIRILGVKS